LENNGFTGEIREGGVGPEPFPFEKSYDLIIWNLPYIVPQEIEQVLGPMEEAALIDTDDQGLGNRFLCSITSNHLLAPKGRVLALGRENSVVDTKYLAHRVWDEIEFEDGERLELTCYWRPFEGATSTFLESTGSTNEDLFAKTGIGTHISTSWQTAGRGRRGRTWTSIEGSYAGSWIVAEGSEINPGHLQLSGGLAVLKSLNKSELRLKWPNDILIGKRKVCGVLAEGRTFEDGTRVVLGFGINLKSGEHNVDVEIATLEEIINIEHNEFDGRLNCELASLLESLDDIPPIRYSEIRSEVLKEMRRMGKPMFKGEIYDDFNLNNSGELILGTNIVDDGEEISWN
jgi:biotin-[acetyl-CoA-carboxylase] ligase BirA-like protein